MDTPSREGKVAHQLVLGAPESTHHLPKGSPSIDFGRTGLTGPIPPKASPLLAFIPAVPFL